MKKNGHLDKLWDILMKKKDKGLRPYHIPKNQNPIENIWQNIYYTYQIICDRSGLVDFSELLLRVYELLKRDSQILYYYRKRFTNILIDEFQDTNHIQYSWIYQLTDQNNSNIMVVGDDDQAIYSWRGAQIENIKHFLHDFSNVQIIRLEQNYRSTNNILQSANALISYNDDRMDKNLWTTRHKGELITLYCASNELDEARFIINCIKIHHDKGNNLNQNAILYRNNSQSRVLEEVLLYMNLSYCIYGGIRFFERQEIKNVLSYLRLIINHHDDIAYERIINIPPRGIGKKTINTIRNIAFQKKVSLWEASHILLLNHSCTPSIIRSLQNFVKLIYNLKKEIMELPLYMQTDFVIKNSGLWNMYQEKHENSYIRIENLKELVTATHQFQDGNNETGFFLLQKFLAHSILNENIEKSRCSTDSIQLMTLHAAKGLEFSQVFIIGLEEGLFPNHISLSNETHLKEERRLAYVGMTRAMHKLTLSYAKTRRIYGEKICHKPSRFLNEIPTVYIEKIHSLNETKIEKTKNTIQLKNVKNNNLSIGTNVYHTQFGEGIIINIRGIGDNSKLQISFKHQGIKWIMSDYIFIKRV